MDKLITGITHFANIRQSPSYLRRTPRVIPQLADIDYIGEALLLVTIVIEEYKNQRGK